MAVEHHRERELTFDVPADFALPSLTDVVPAGGAADEATYGLEATYYDTEAGILRRLGMTLRRREGGHDAGWHLKIPTEDARSEVQSRSASAAVPASLRRRVAGVVGDESVRPVATIITKRRVTRLLDAHGGLVAELADDAVVGRQLSDGTAPVDWREVEVELGEAGAEGDLAALSELLTGAAARPAVVERKINHVLGEPRLESAPGIPGLVQAYVHEQCRAILVGDVLLRDDPAPEPIHQTRVAIRRLRSTVRLFGRAVDLSSAEHLDDDLRWLAAALSPIRDADILARRMARELDELPPQDLVGPVREEVHRELVRRRSEAVRRLRDGWTDERYLRVMAVLVSWFERVPLTDIRRTPWSCTVPASRPSGCGTPATSWSPYPARRRRRPGPNSCRPPSATTRT